MILILRQCDFDFAMCHFDFDGCHFDFGLRDFDFGGCHFDFGWCHIDSGWPAVPLVTWQPGGTIPASRNVDLRLGEGGSAVQRSGNALSEQSMQLETLTHAEEPPNL